jgi:hypothetical protein
LGQETVSAEMRAEIAKLVEECRAALRNRGEEND